MNYEEARKKYAFKQGDIALSKQYMRMCDFDALDFELEMYKFRPTAEQVEEILDLCNEYIANDDYIWESKREHLRDAFQKVTGLNMFYLDEVEPSSPAY